MRIPSLKEVWKSLLIFLLMLCIVIRVMTSTHNMNVNCASKDGYVNNGTEVHTEAPPSSQQARQALLQELCRKPQFQDPNYVQTDFMGLPYYSIRSAMFQSLWVDDRRRLVFCKVHKVASTVWRTALVNSSPQSKGHLKNATLATEQNMGQAGLMSLGLMTLPEVMDRLKHFRKVMFVRHPLKRILSAYRDRLRPEGPDQGIVKLISEFLRTHNLRVGDKQDQESQPKEITFEEFVRYVVWTLNMSSPDPHWTPVSATCLPCLVSYDFVGKLETSSTDFAYVIKHYALRSTFPANLEGPSSRRLNMTTDAAFRKYYSQLPVNLLNELVRLYRRDFMLFGYDIENPLTGL